MSEIKSKEELGRELRWLRAKQERDLREIDQLKEQIKGYEELIAINNGLVAAVLNAVGEIIVPRDAVTKAMKELEVVSAFDTERNCFTMKAVPLVRETVRAEAQE